MTLKADIWADVNGGLVMSKAESNNFDGKHDFHFPPHNMICESKDCALHICVYVSKWLVYT